ncbi:MAG TPA: ATP-binding protein [Ramlibacter sp.]|uniref:ATP-binding protein n=1 Tax=Ramlibacter sp. TaxID=1917967 RepID=UPI002D7F7EFF|nr:ATP-binding protein [Ramlibacter sp.]HET8745740.1 ATP-binding protein [Ramlibacter sp.]
MDKAVRPSLHARLLAALAASLPPDQFAHPDAQWLRDPPPQPVVDEAVLAPLVAALDLAPVEHAAAALALWVELDARPAAALSLLQGSASRIGPARPTLGLLASLAGSLDEDGPSPAEALGRLLQGTALASGLLQLSDPQQPAHARTLQMPACLVAWLACGEPAAHATPLGRLRLQPLGEPCWPLPAAWAEAVVRLGAAAQASRGPCALVLRGIDAGELRAMAARLAARMGRIAFEIEGTDEARGLSSDAVALLSAREGVVPALVAARGIPVWQAEAAPGSATRVPGLAHWTGPLIVLAAPDAAFESTLPMHEGELGLPDARDRLALWSGLRKLPADAIGPGDRGAVARSRCGISVLAQAAAHARDGQAHRAIEEAVRASARSLSAWAQLSSDRIPADAWVGPPEVHRELGLLLTRCLARAGAGERLGPLLRGRLGDGVKTLFIGASGTGKTLAAQWLADRLARPLVRVDLAAVVSKYIGETEKNLAQLLSRAEHLDAVLLFDEADSLFGARTDVKQANDRYANMQTNYLLQRLETFHGVAVLTSNSKARFDDAFLRRLDAVVQFPLPDVAERRTLWSLHLGEAPQVDPSVMNAIAALVDLPGGHIRNAVLTAALLARQRGQDGEAESSLTADDLREALALEYRKLGQRAPDSF